MSKSEGWPKVVAEAMFWKCLPISTKVSCIPEMLDNGERGSIVSPSLDEITNEITFYIKNPAIYNDKVLKAYNWSRTYTLDKFEESIKKILVAY
jgi:glycosyltransferase involved in cell wall biosynthesis